MKFEINISIDEAIAFLRSFGLTVERHDTPTEFFCQHKREYYDDVISVWTVVNPYNTTQTETVENFMRKFIARKTNTLLQQVSKIEVLSIFLQQ